MSEPLVDLGGATRVAVISDTHGVVRPELYARLEGADAILHAGDLGSETIEIELAPIAPFYAVAGNVDGFGASVHPRRRLFRIGRRLVGMTHVALARGDLVPSVAAWCRANDVHTLVFGHTHAPLVDDAHIPVRFNPGACGPRRFRLPVTIGFLDVRDGVPVPSITELGAGRE